VDGVLILIRRDTSKRDILEKAKKYRAVVDYQILKDLSTVFFVGVHPSLMNGPVK
jgi:hypothetical protein